jgi:hypothetical protein
LASVAVRLKDHSGIPNRRVRSAPTHSASSLGIIVVIPPSSPIRRCTASTVARREWPAIAGVTEGEVDVGVAVDVRDAVAVRLGRGRAG